MALRAKTTSNGIEDFIVGIRFNSIVKKHSNCFRYVFHRIFVSYCLQPFLLFSLDDHLYTGFVETHLTDATPKIDFIGLGLHSLLAYIFLENYLGVSNYSYELECERYAPGTLV